MGWLDQILFDAVTHIIRTFDLNTVLMQVLLGFLLFAGAIHIDIKMLKKESAAIIVQGLTIGKFARKITA